jgi:hypothetical protein
MKTIRFSVSVLWISLILLFTACNFQQPDVESDVELLTPILHITVQPTPTAIMTEPPEFSNRVAFEELGISLEIPADLYVRKDPQVNYEDQSKLDGYLFYIQNYGYPEGPSSGNFQMYGHLQFNLLKISWDDFSNNQINSPMNTYADYIEIGSLRGYDTQVAGQRNRYVYHFYLDGYVLSIYVSDPTPENKVLSDQIIQSLQFLPEGITQESHMQLVNDPNQLFQILIPDDWEYSYQPAVGTRLSGLDASSPDQYAYSEDVEGPHANVYYKSGVFMQLQVLSDDSAPRSPFPNLTRKEYDVYFNGIPGREYIFTQPSTVEGEEREAQVYYEGRSYLLRFAYADDTYRYLIDRIIASFNITPETFYPSP